MSQQDHAKHWTQFEQLRKQKEKNTKSSSLKKKEETQESKEELAEETLLKEEVDGDHKAEPGANPSKDGEPVKSPEEEAERREEPSEKLPKPAHNRQPSLSVQSRMRSSSFRRTSVSQTPASPNLDGNKSPTLTAMSPDGDAVTDIYRKQATRLDELEKENRRLSEDAREFEKRWKTTEEELEELREASSEVADLKTKANKANSLEEECTKLVSDVYSTFSFIDS